MTLSSTPTVLAYGELLWDCLPSGELLGGAPSNVAFRLSTLGIDAKPVSRIGKDVRGDRAIEILRNAGLNCSLIQRDEHIPTGIVDVTLDAAGNASYVINTGAAYDEIKLTTELEEAAQKCAVLYFGALVQRAPKSRATLQALLEIVPKTALRFFDINLRKDCFSESTVSASLKRCDILKLNDDEVEVVCGLLGWPKSSLADFAIRVLEMFPIRSCLITRGADGAYCRSASGEIADIAGYPVPVMDTIGAGDAFAAGFLQSILTGKSFFDACVFGNKLGTAVAQKPGAMCILDEVFLNNLPTPARNSSRP